MLYAFLITIVAIGSGAAFVADRNRAARVRRVHLIARIQRGEAAQVLLQEQDPFARRARRARSAMQRRSRRLTRAGRRRDELSSHAWHGERWSFGFVVVMLVGACLWVILFVLQRAMDVNMLVALGYASPAAFGTVIALVFAVVGMIVAGQLGLHPLLPPWVKPAGRFGRMTAALLLAALSIAFMAYLQKIAVHRSVDRFGPDGARLPSMLTTAVPAAELALSAAPILAVELAVVGYYAIVANRADRRLDAARRAIRSAQEGFDRYAMALLAEAGEPVVTSRQRLADVPELSLDSIFALDGHGPPYQIRAVDPGDEQSSPAPIA